VHASIPARAKYAFTCSPWMKRQLSRGPRSVSPEIADFSRQRDQFLQELADQLLRGLAGELAIGVEILCRAWNHDFGLGDRRHVEEHEHLAQVILRTRCPHHADRS